MNNVVTISDTTGVAFIDAAVATVRISSMFNCEAELVAQCLPRPKDGLRPPDTDRKPLLRPDRMQMLQEFRIAQGHSTFALGWHWSDWT